MSHAREQIREAFRIALVGNTDAGSNVFVGRTYPIQAALTKAIIIYTLNESAEPATIGSLGSARSYQRDLTVIVEGFSKSNASTEQTLDDLAIDIETFIESDASLRSLVDDYYLSNTEMQLEANETPIGNIRLSYTVRYRTRPGAPETIIP